MPGLSFEIKIVFEPAGKAEGEICSNCGKEIKGEKYQGVLQFGFIEQLSLKAIKLFLCDRCHKQYEATNQTKQPESEE